jgi:thiaminase
MGSKSSAVSLLNELEDELGDLEKRIRTHGFLDRLERGDIDRAALSALACEQHAIISSDRRSFSLAATRVPAQPAGAFFLSMAQGEVVALGRLVDFAEAIGLNEDSLVTYEPDPRAQAYPAFVAWIALNGSAADLALAFLANLAAWGENCGRVAKALRAAYGLDDRAVAFFDFFATPSEEFRSSAVEVVDDGLARGDSPVAAKRAARLLQTYELMFWDSIDG